MGLREKVALMIAFTTLIQITFVSCSSRDKTPTKNLKHVKQVSRSEPARHSPIMVSLRPQKKGIKYSKPVPDKNHEAIYKTFKFPDVEYPTASTPRPPFHLQETNLERNPVQRAADYQTSTNSQYPLKDNRVYKKKYNTNAHSKTNKKPGTTVTVPDFGITPKPYYFKEEGTFSEVEYPLSAKDIWKPNYWKQIPNGEFQNQPYKDGPENISNIGSNTNTGKTPTKAVVNSVSKSESKKTAPKNTQQDTNSSSMNNTQNKVNTNQKPRKKNLVVIDVNLPKRKTNKANDQNVTPSPNQSVCTKSTTPFVLTPYTTIYFDTTSPSEDKQTTPKNGNKSTKRRSKKKRKKKKPAPKKDDSSTRSKKTTLDDSGTHMTPSTPAITSDKNTKPSEPTSKVNVSKSDTCTYLSNNKLTSTSLVTTPTYFDNLQTTVSPLTKHNDDKMPNMPCDKVVSISDAINATVPYSKDKDSSCIEDTVINSNKSSTCSDKSNESPLSPRESDEEFTTDVFPDFDENMSPAYTISTSTLSPLSSIEEAWAKSEVIDFYKSLAYPDELEEMYIIVK